MSWKILQSDWETCSSADLCIIKENECTTGPVIYNHLVSTTKSDTVKNSCLYGCDAQHTKFVICCITYASIKVRIRLPTLALKPRGDVTRSPKQEYQWSHKKDSCPTKILKKSLSYVCSIAIYFFCSVLQRKFLVIITQTEEMRRQQELPFLLTKWSKGKPPPWKWWQNKNFIGNTEVI